MAITELVILPLKPGKDLRAEVYEKLPSLMCTSFGISGGPRAMTLARILESTPADAEDHRGYAGVITWESLEMIQSFLKTPEFSNFKLSLTEYVDQPPVLQFFEAIANTAPERTIRNSTHLFAIKASGSKDQVDQARNQWSDMTTTFLSIAGGQVLYHSGEGRGENDGQFAGFSGWKSIAALQQALEDGKVQEQLRGLRNLGANISSFTLELKHVI